MNLSKLNERKSWLISGGIAAAVTVWLLSGQFVADEPTAHGGLDETRADEERPSAVRVRTQTAETVQRRITVNGKTAPSRIVRLAAETDGRVVFIGAERGSSITKGGLVLRLDERDRAARLAEAEATVRQREVEYEGRLQLKSQSYVSEAQLQEAVAALEAAKAELTRAQLDLGYMTITAPFDGALQSREVEVGDFVSRGDPVATFVDNRTIIVSASLSEFDAQHVSVGDKASAELATGESVQGRIRFIAPVADESTRTFAVELEVDNADGRLRAGGTAELSIPAEEVLAHRVSPALLTLDDAGNFGVKIVDDAGRVRFVVADIALATSDGVWLAGLPTTATIITVGQGYVTDGSVVRAVAEDEVATAVASRGGDDEAD